MSTIDDLPKVDPTQDRQDISEILSDPSLTEEDREMWESELAGFGGAVVEAAVGMLQNDIDAGEKIGKLAESAGEQARIPKYSATKEKISWLGKDSEVPIRRIKTQSGAFWYGDISDLSPRTRIPTRFMPKKTRLQLETQIIHHCIVQVDEDDGQARMLRPMTNMDTTPARTKLTPYSDDQVAPGAFKNGDIRALVLRDDSPVMTGEGTKDAKSEPVFLLGTAVRHDNDQIVYNI